MNFIHDLLAAWIGACVMYVLIIVLFSMAPDPDDEDES
jgi:hypothetical protein